MSERTEDQRIRERISKLLALAGDGAAFEGEVANALRFAQQLMDAHHLDAADCRDTHESDAAEERMIRQAAWCGGKKASFWEGYASQAIAKTIGTIGIYCDSRASGRDLDGSYRDGAAYVFYGPDADVRLATELFAEIIKTIAAMSRLRYGGVYRGPGRSYAEGFALALRQKAAEGERQRVEACTALVVATVQRARIWLATSEGIRIGSPRSGGGRSCDGSAHNAGRSDGRNYSMRGRQRQLPRQQLLFK